MNLEIYKPQQNTDRPAVIKLKLIWNALWLSVTLSLLKSSTDFDKITSFGTGFAYAPRNYIVKIEAFRGEIGIGYLYGKLMNLKIIYLYFECHNHSRDVKINIISHRPNRGLR